MTITSEMTCAELPPAAPDVSIDKTGLFLHWLEENGATVSSVRLRLDHDVRDIYASKPVAEGQMLMHIPRRLMITREVAMASEVGRLISANGLDFSDYEYIAAFLAMVRREGGFYKPYVDVLPQDMSDNPALFSDQELSYLKGTSALDVIQGEIAWTRYEYKQLAAILPLEWKFAEHEYAWAKAIVRTRVHGVILDGESRNAMVPLACMLNHSDKYNTIWQRESNCGFTQSAAEDLDEGAPLTISYGSLKGNSRLFRVYGFCMADNARNDAALRFAEPVGEGRAAVLARTLGEAYKGMRAFHPVADCSDDTVRDMLSYLRLCNLEDADDAHLSPVSRNNELAALAALAAACRQGFARFDTSIEEDEALLASASLSRNLRNAVRVRQGEKMVLRYLLRLAESGMALLEGRAAAHSFPGYFEKLRPLLSSEGHHAVTADVALLDQG